MSASASGLTEAAQTRLTCISGARDDIVAAEFAGTRRDRLIAAYRLNAGTACGGAGSRLVGSAVSDAVA